MQRPPLARRASRLPGSLPAPPPDGTISFESGHAYPGILPELGVVAERALTAYRTEALQYGPRAGLPEFQTWIAEYLAHDGVAITPEHVLVTNGAKHAIDLVCRLLLDEGDSMVVTAPTYFTAIPIFRSFGASFIEVGQDREGLDVDELSVRLEAVKREGRPLPKLIYNVPDYHNPTGVTMSLERRKALMELALEKRIFILEDSPYRHVRFEGASLPSLKSLDRGDLVFQLGTFSKLIAPGLRVGWVAAAPELTARLTQLKSDGGSCPLMQRVILDFCAAGELPVHTERVRATYRRHRDRMLTALRRELPEVSTDVPSGGYYLWLTLPPEMDGAELAERACEAGVSILPGSRCYARADAGHPANHVRLAFSHAAPDEIDEGIRRLASAFRSLAEASPLAPGR